MTTQAPPSCRTIFRIGMLFFILVIYLFIGFADIKYLKKLVEDAWAGFVPVYNVYCPVCRLLKNHHGFSFYFMFHLFLIMHYFVTGDKLGKGFGKGEKYCLGIIGLLMGYLLI